MIDNSTNPAPMGLGALTEDEVLEGEQAPAVEIELVLPEDPDGEISVMIDGTEIKLGGEEGEVEIVEHDANLAEHMTESELESLSSELMLAIEADINSRKDWVEMFVRGLEVLGMKYEERTDPWSGACGVFSTLLIEAAVRFQSETIIETFPSAGPVKAKIVGKPTQEKEDAAKRVTEDMNFQLTEEMPEYRPEHERMLFNLGLAGSAFKKVYFDPSLDRPTSVFIPAEEVVIPYGCSGVRSAERVTHIMRKTENDVRKLQVAGFYRDIDLGEPVISHDEIDKRKAEEQGYTLSDDNRYQFYEVQVDIDLPGFEDPDGIALPYVITMDKQTGKVLSIYRNWAPDDKTRQKQQYFVQYDYVPGFGAYGFGYIHLIGGYARAGTSLIRQLVDAGTLSNLPGGLKSRGLRIKGDDTPIAPGEWRDVDVPSGSVRDNIMPLPYKEPSQVLAGLLDRITEEGRRLGSIADMKISDMSANSPVGTTLAILERQLKTMSAVQARLHYSMKQEFKLLKGLIRDTAPAGYSYEPLVGNRMARQADYDMVDVIPVSDPNSSTMAQRIMQYQAVIQLAQGAPQIYDLPELHRQMIEVLGVKNADKLVPVKEDRKPLDPISENMRFLTGSPNKAFIYQDHQAHITAHTTFMQDPSIAQQIGQNPMAQQMSAAIMAHIAEHTAFMYRRKIEEQMGVTLPEPDAEIPKEMELQLSELVAQAAQQLLQVNKSQAQQQQAQQQAQDPLVQMQQAELKIKAQEAATKAQKVQGDLAIKSQELSIKAQEAASRQTESPEQISQRMAIEMQHKEQMHQQKLQHAAQEHQLKIAEKQQEMMEKQRQKFAPIVPPVI